MNLEARFILLELQLMQANKKIEDLADTVEWLRVKSDGASQPLTPFSTEISARKELLKRRSKMIKILEEQDKDGTL